MNADDGWVDRWAWCSFCKGLGNIAKITEVSQVVAIDCRRTRCGCLLMCAEWVEMTPLALVKSHYDRSQLSRTRCGCLLVLRRVWGDGPIALVDTHHDWWAASLVAKLYNSILESNHEPGNDSEKLWLYGSSGVVPVLGGVQGGTCLGLYYWPVGCF